MASGTSASGTSALGISTTGSSLSGLSLVTGYSIGFDKLVTTCSRTLASYSGSFKTDEANFFTPSFEKQSEAPLAIHISEAALKFSVESNPMYFISRPTESTRALSFAISFACWAS